MMESQNQGRVVFKDISSSGKDRNWRGKKLKNIELGKRLEILGYKSFERVYLCSEVLKFIEQENGIKKLYQTYFCKNKLCPICNWRRSLKYSYQSEKIINKAIEMYPNGQFLFLTLTIKNVKGNELKESISRMSKGFNKLLKYTKVNKNILGFLRATEVTYNQNSKDYHPHFHVLLFVKSSYFTRDNYLNHDEWTIYWKRAMKLDYSPIIDVRKVYSKSGQDDLAVKKAILETAKYPVKPFDVESRKDGKVVCYSEQEKLQITDDLMSGLFKKRQIGFGKLFKEIKKELELDDLENGDLVKTSEGDEIKSKGKEIIAIWNWERKNYFLKDR